MQCSDDVVHFTLLGALGLPNQGNEESTKYMAHMVMLGLGSF